MITRRTIMAIASGVAASPLLSALSVPAIAAPSETPFEAFRSLSDETRQKLIFDYNLHNDAHLHGMMWIGRFSVYQLALTRAAEHFGASSFADYRQAFTLQYAIDRLASSDLPDRIRRMVRQAVDIPWGFNPDSGLAQDEKFLWMHGFIETHLARMLDHFERGYPSSIADMKRGTFDWDRAEARALPARQEGYPWPKLYA